MVVLSRTRGSSAPISRSRSAQTSRSFSTSRGDSVSCPQSAHASALSGLIDAFFLLQDLRRLQQEARLPLRPHHLRVHVREALHAWAHPPWGPTPLTPMGPLGVREALHADERRLRALKEIGEKSDRARGRRPVARRKLAERERGLGCGPLGEPSAVRLLRVVHLAGDKGDAADDAAGMHGLPTGRIG